jgi:hypothetical protein
MPPKHAGFHGQTVPVFPQDTPFEFVAAESEEMVIGHSQDIVQRISEENMNKLTGDSGTFNNLMNSEVFKQSNYRDAMFDTWLQNLNEHIKELNQRDL